MQRQQKSQTAKWEKIQMLDKLLLLTVKFFFCFSRCDKSWTVLSECTNIYIYIYIYIYETSLNNNNHINASIIPYTVTKQHSLSNVTLVLEVG